MMAPLSLGNFYGIDSLIDFLITLVAILVGSQSYRIYKITKDKNYKFFSWSFILISLGYLSKILANLTIFYRIKVLDLDFISFIIEEFNEINYIHFISFTFYKIFLLLGLLALFLTTKKNNKNEEIYLFVYLSLIAILFSIYFNFIFYLTIAVLLMILALYFYDNYKEKKSNRSLTTFIAFAIILTGSIINLFYIYNGFMYLFSETITFVGFLLIFLNHINLKNE